MPRVKYRVKGFRNSRALMIWLNRMSYECNNMEKGVQMRVVSINAVGFILPQLVVTIEIQDFSSPNPSIKDASHGEPV